MTYSTWAPSPALLSLVPAVVSGALLSPLLPTPTAVLVIARLQSALPSHPTNSSQPGRSIVAPALCLPLPLPLPLAFAPSLVVSPAPLSSPLSPVGRGVKRAADGGPGVDEADDGLWHCSLGCGRQYEKSSGRSIRSHMTSCFRSHWPGGQELNESDVQALMSAQQESGQLVTGLRRWKKRQSCRPTSSLAEDETWTCPNGCSKVYRLTSSRSIQQHALDCTAHGASSETDEPAATTEQALAGHCPSTTITAKPHDDAASLPSLSPVSIASTTTTTSSSVSQSDETATIATTAHTPFSQSSMPGQYDGMADYDSFMVESDDTTHALLARDGDNMHDTVFSPTTLTAQFPSFAYGWKDTPLRSLLRRHQVEIQQTNARHVTEIIALHESSVGVYTETAYPYAYSVPLLQAQ